MRAQRLFIWLIVLAFHGPALPELSAQAPLRPGMPGERHLEPPDGTAPTPPAAGATACTAGRAAGYPCHDIDLQAFVPREELGGPGVLLNDIWGWTDPATGREYALVGLSNGTAFVDITLPGRPVVLGRLPTSTVATAWRDIKTYRDHAYVVADLAGGHGMQVFDLTRLRDVAQPPVTFEADLVYRGAGLGFGVGALLGSAHNLAINEETGYAYVVGSDTCAAGLHMVDLANPAQPRFAGCFPDDGYTHDAQCVIYHGPDQDHIGHELCFAANEDTLTIVDVSDKRAPRLLARQTYAGSGYTHQGWLTEDHHHFLLGDEFDEMQQGPPSKTYVWDVTDVDAPRLAFAYTGPSAAIDHNLYVRGDLVYEANYRSGLRILDASGLAVGRLEEVAFFDVYPADDGLEFSGAWSVYPFFPSGNVVVSGIEQGLYVLRPRPHQGSH